MQNKIQVFSSEQFGSVRTAFRNGKSWFVGKNVALVFGKGHFIEKVPEIPKEME